MKRLKHSPANEPFRQRLKSNITMILCLSTFFVSAGTPRLLGENIKNIAASPTPSPAVPTAHYDTSTLMLFWQQKKSALEKELRSIHNRTGKERKKMLHDYLECLHVVKTLESLPDTEEKQPLNLESARDAVLQYRFSTELLDWLKQKRLENSSQREIALLLEAKIYESSRDFTCAARLYDTISQSTTPVPLKAHIIHMSAAAYSRAGSEEAAKKRLETLLEQYGNFVWKNKVRSSLAVIYLDRNDFESVLHILRESPETAETLWYKAKAYRGLGRKHAEQDVLKRMWIHYPASAYSADVEQRLRRICAETNRPFPDISRKDRYHRAQRFEKTGLRFEAAGIYRALIAANRRDEIDAKSRLFLARLYHDTRKNRKALETYRDFLDRYPRHASVPTALFRMGTIYRRLNDTKNFLRVTNKIISKHQGSSRWSDALFRRGKYYREEGRFEKALEDFSRVTSRGGDTRNMAVWKRAWILFDLKRFKDAADLFDDLIKREAGTGWEPISLYWRGRCLEEAGFSAEALRCYEAAATHFPWDYAGQLSLKYRNTAGAARLPWTPDPDPELTSSVRNDPRVRSALILERAGYFERAAAEWRRVLHRHTGTPAVALHYARSLFKAGHPLKSRRILLKEFTRQRCKGTLPVSVAELIYPLPKEIRGLLVRTARKYGLDPLFVSALILQESAFDPAALSYNLAVGYMQITPALFRTKNNVSDDSLIVRELFDPFRNLDIGMAYLSDLMARYNNCLPYVLAAYNAGEHRVDIWKRQYSGMPEEIWTEHIPFRQTRLFVKKILENYGCYRRIYKNEING